MDLSPSSPPRERLPELLLRASIGRVCMLLGPVFGREAVIAPRRMRTYVGRAAYVAALLLLMGTAWLVLTGTQLVRDVGDLARFGADAVPDPRPAAVGAGGVLFGPAGRQRGGPGKGPPHAGAAAADQLSNSELVLGKLLASLLGVLMLLAAAFPLFMLAALFGGVSFGQIGRVWRSRWPACWPAAAWARRWPCGGKRPSRPWP